MRDGVRQILLLLDVYAKRPAAEVCAQLPPAGDRQVLSLRDFGAPNLDRAQAVASKVDWRALADAVAALSRAAAHQVTTAGPPVHFYVCGLAPLPVFFLLGRSLPSRVGRQTFINERPDGTWDIMPLSAPVGEGDFFDVVRGLHDPGEEAARKGMIAVFISSLGGPAPEGAIRDLLRRRGQAIAGLIEIRTSRWALLEQSNLGLATAQLARLLSQLRAQHPTARGAAFFVAGPAHLSFVVGRVMPGSLPEPWFAHFRPETGDYELAIPAPPPRGARVERVGLQIYLDGAWHDAAEVRIDEPDQGLRSPTRIEYDDAYFFSHAGEALDGGKVRDLRALSVRHPVEQDASYLPTWPPFLVDLLPQGHARRRLAAELGLDPEHRAADLPLLRRGAGAPIGNMRVREAWAEEQERLRGVPVVGVTTAQVMTRARPFLELADRFALLASGSSGVQGELPKLLLTLSGDGLWYPDSVLPDGDARAHALVKMSRARFEVDRLILASEAPYLAVARAFGLRAAEVMDQSEDMLLLLRFDRRVEGGQVVRLGQESLVAALGEADYGLVTNHERYLAVLQEVCTDPLTEIVEYVLRDALNEAMGDTDNHGRNTALQKRPDGWIGLAPRYDFSPMVLDPGLVRPSTTWACLRDQPRLSRVRRYERICAAVAALAGDETAAAVRAALVSRGARFAALPDLAQEAGVPARVLDKIRGAAVEVAAAIELLSG